MKREFDCVEMKRRIQDEIFEEIKDLDDAERAEHTRRAVESGRLADFWRRLRTREEIERDAAKRRESA